MNESSLTTYCKKTAGLAAYSSRARATQRSIVAALLSNTSSINRSSLRNVRQQAGTCRIQCCFFAKDRRLEQPRMRVFRPPTLAPCNDLVLHHRGCRSEEHTSELQSLMRISYAVFCLKKKNKKKLNTNINLHV